MNDHVAVSLQRTSAKQTMNESIDSLIGVDPCAGSQLGQAVGLLNLEVVQQLVTSSPQIQILRYLQPHNHNFRTAITTSCLVAYLWSCLHTNMVIVAQA